MCLNKKVIAGLAVAALAVLAFDPHALRWAIPLLAVAACPLSMLVMVFAMTRARRPAAADRRPGASPHGADPDSGAELRELQEEINLLHAELRLRDQRPSGQ